MPFFASSVNSGLEALRGSSDLYRARRADLPDAASCLPKVAECNPNPNSGILPRADLKSLG